MTTIATNLERALDALRLIASERDYFAQHGTYREVYPSDRCFDDWAADLADSVLKDVTPAPAVETSTGTTQRDYRDAMFSQSAPNGGALIKSLAEVIPRIWEDARERGEGTRYVNQHPIVLLYLTQLLHLCTGDMIDQDKYADAAQVCRERAGDLYKD